MKPTLIFDMDGTLNRCGEYYKAVMEEFAEYQASRFNGAITKDLALKLLSEIDLAATVMPGAFNRDRFPRSFMAASVAIDVLAETTVNEEAANRSWTIGDNVFEAPYELYTSAWETLKYMKSAGWHMVIVTKGDTGVQWDKVRKNNLDVIIGHGNIYVTLKKSAEYLQTIVDEQEIDPNTSWVIGDSLKDDIAPGLALGLKTILVDSGTWWSYDHHEVEPTHVITDLSELVSIVGKPCLQTA